MNRAHLTRLLAVLPRPSWGTTLRYLADHSVSGTYSGSVRSMWIGTKERSPIALSHSKVKESLHALQNLLVISASSAPTGTTDRLDIHLSKLSDSHLEDLCFALTRAAATKKRRRVQRLWMALERPRATDSELWADVAPLLLGRHGELTHLLLNSFLGTQAPADGAGTRSHGEAPTSGTRSQPSAPSPVKSKPWCGSDFAPDAALSSLELAPTSEPGEAPRQDFIGSFSSSEGSVPERQDRGLRRARGTPHENDDNVRTRRETVLEINRATEPSGSRQHGLPRKRKTVPIRAQPLQQWEHWKSVQPLMHRIYGPSWLAFESDGGEPHETIHGGFSKVVAGISPVGTNPDAIKTIEVLMKGHFDLLKCRISPTGVPALLLKAWIGYAHLFNQGYTGPGDQNVVPALRIVFRALTRKQKRVPTTELLQRMAGFAWRMQQVRQNRRGQFYPKIDWREIYGFEPKYTFAWQEALRQDAGIKDPLSYMLGLEPFVNPTDDEGRPIQPPEPSPSERLAELRRQLAERVPFVRARSVLGAEEWDKLPESRRMDDAIGLKNWNELKRLEKELEGDPPVQVVP